MPQKVWLHPGAFIFCDINYEVGEEAELEDSRNLAGGGGGEGKEFKIQFRTTVTYLSQLFDGRFVRQDNYYSCTVY
jgi:hypothetical protein